MQSRLRSQLDNDSKSSENELAVAVTVITEKKAATDLLLFFMERTKTTSTVSDGSQHHTLAKFGCKSRQA